MSSSVSSLQRFAFNQARFVFATSRTVEREIMCGLVAVDPETTVGILRETPLGQKYLRGVTLAEIKTEMSHPGSFMNANTDFGYWIPDDGNYYVEQFEEK